MCEDVIQRRQRIQYEAYITATEPFRRAAADILSRSYPRKILIKNDGTIKQIHPYSTLKALAQIRITCRMIQKSIIKEPQILKGK